MEEAEEEEEEEREEDLCFVAGGSYFPVTWATRRRCK